MTGVSASRRLLFSFCLCVLQVEAELWDNIECMFELVEDSDETTLIRSVEVRGLGALLLLLADD